MNKFFACVALFGLVAIVAQSVNGQPIQGADVSEEEQAMALALSQSVLNPTSDEETANNKYDAFNGHCIEVNEYVVQKFTNGVNDVKTEALKRLVEELSHASSSISQLQSHVLNKIKLHGAQLFGLPESLHPTVQEVDFNSDDVKRAVEELERTSQGSLTLKNAVQFFVAGVKALATEYKNKAKAEYAAQVSKAMEIAKETQQSVEDICDGFKDNFSKPLAQKFNQAKKEILESFEGDDEQRRTYSVLSPKDIGCITVRRVNLVDTFCKSAPALLPLAKSLLGY